jgi:bifunctional DNA-binding transcriptional regulator/antitoxin component of YhaV-PrlF toxin-antitoxin module
METSVLTAKEQLLIPKRLRDKYGFKSGGKSGFIKTQNGLILKAMNEAYFDQFAGILKDATPTTAEYKAWKKGEQAKEEKRMDKKFSSPAKRKR